MGFREGLEKKYPHLIGIIVIGLLIGGLIYIQYGHTPEVCETNYLVTFSEGNTDLLQINCDIAITNEEHSDGLMNVESLPMDRGMLFYFEEPENVSFWMKNTYVPLDMVFIGPNMTVLNIEEADVQANVSINDLVIYKSAGPVKYVVEMNQGLAVQYGIEPGSEMRYTIVQKTCG